MLRMEWHLAISASALNLLSTAVPKQYAVFTTAAAYIATVNGLPWKRKPMHATVSPGDKSHIHVTEITRHYDEMLNDHCNAMYLNNPRYVADFNSVPIYILWFHRLPITALCRFPSMAAFHGHMHRAQVLVSRFTTAAKCRIVYPMASVSFLCVWSRSDNWRSGNTHARWCARACTQCAALWQHDVSNMPSTMAQDRRKFSDVQRTGTVCVGAGDTVPVDIRWRHAAFVVLHNDQTKNSSSLRA